jgi:hypothetical protein
VQVEKRTSLRTPERNIPLLPQKEHESFAEELLAKALASRESPIIFLW